MDASIFDSALSHTRRSDASKKREEKSVSTFGRFRLWTSFESSPVSVKKLPEKVKLFLAIIKISAKEELLENESGPTKTKRRRLNNKSDS